LPTTDILRAKAATPSRGVASGSGTMNSWQRRRRNSAPGASGAGAGGTTSGTGGAGTGASGLVQSTVGTGSLINSYDPIITGTLSLETRIIPAFQHRDNRHQHLQQNTGIANFNYFQGFKTRHHDERGVQ